MRLFWGGGKRHKHEWETVSESIVPSFSDRFGAIAGLPNIGTWVYERKLVINMKCKCGKTKKIIRASQ